MITPAQEKRNTSSIGAWPNSFDRRPPKCCKVSPLTVFHHFLGQSSNTIGFENGADLGFSTINHMNTNLNMPYCQNKNQNSHRKLIIFFAHHQSSAIILPNSIKKHIQTGCKGRSISDDVLNSTFFESKRVFAEQRC